MQNYYRETPEPMERHGYNKPDFQELIHSQNIQDKIPDKYQNKAINLMDIPGYIFASFAFYSTLYCIRKLF